MPDFPFPIKAGFNVAFSTADIEFHVKDVPKMISWLKSIIDHESGYVSELDFIFCSDDFLHKMNIEYLGHDTLTDIITFPINLNPIKGEIYISIDRIKENAEKHHQPFEDELRRVMAHGVYHLLGFGDKTPSETQIMREKEDFALRQWVLIA